MNNTYNPLPCIGSANMHFYVKRALSFLCFILFFNLTNCLLATERNSFNELAIDDIPNAFGQILSMPSDGKAVSYKIDCFTENQFRDDGYPLYTDEQGKPRADTLTICPQNQSQSVKVTFTEFDISLGDALAVYDGDLTAVKNGTAPYINSASGNGASSAFGSWVQANCDPNINPSGCLTFRFTTNGDYQKGKGWEAWITCEERNIQLAAPNITSNLRCGEYYSTLTIVGLKVTSNCGANIDDEVLVEVYGSSGQSCINTSVSVSQGLTATQTFAIGSYSIKYTLKSDPTKTISTVFSIGEPALVCNDRVNVSLGSNCSATIEPDAILENTCPPIPGIMYYDIIIKDANGRVLAKGGKNGTYPHITTDMIATCQENIYTAEITSVYFEDAKLSYCNNGVQRHKCTTELIFQDKTPPVFSSNTQADTIYNCDIALNDEGLARFRPIIIDNCVYKGATFHDATDISGNNSCDKTYLITWKAEDQCGNTAFLERRLEIRRPGIDKIVKVPDAFLSCGEDQADAVNDLNKTGSLGLKVGYQKNGAFYATDTLPLSTTEYVCNYILSKTDQSFPSTCGSKTFRFWQLLDWCNTPYKIIPIDTQLIKFIDTLAPTIQRTPHASLTSAEHISLPAYQCAITPNFPVPHATDKCDPAVKVSMFTVEEERYGQWEKIANNFSQAGALGFGTYRVGWRAYDICPEQVKEDTCYRYFILEDRTAPSAICRDRLNVSIGNTAARLYAKDVDGGSTDACGVDKLFVRRSICDSPGTWAGESNKYIANNFRHQLDSMGWADYVQFECCDLNKVLKLELLVVDKEGNYNFCNMDIKPEDKIVPLCVSLPRQSAFCDDLHSNELGINTDQNNNNQFDFNEWTPLRGDLLTHYNNTYGDPLTSCTDNLICNDLSVEQQYQLLELNCGQLAIKRRYRAIDGQGNTSNWGEQSINIAYRANWSITFPIDWVGDCGSTIPDSNIEIKRGSCDKLAYEVKNQIFETAKGACFQMVRTFTIINGCKYEQEAPAYEVNRIIGNNGMVTSPQTISSDDWGNYGKITYSQVLEIRDTEAPIISIAEVEKCITSETCDGIKTFSVSAEDCNEASTKSLIYTWEIFENGHSKGTGETNRFEWTVQAGIPYEVKWYVFDQCGNSSWEKPTYLFKDCKKPVPYCLDGIAVSLMENGTISIWAKDIDLGSYDNCTNIENLELRLFHEESGTRPTSLEAIQQLTSSLTFNCSYIGTQNLSLYTLDQAGNWDFCTANVNVQDNQAVCDYGQVAGKIYTQDGTAVEQTEVKIEGPGTMPSPYMTTTNGSYGFALNRGNTYTIRPYKNTNLLNGVSTLDIVRVTKHILGIEKFAYPYQYIAADINKSKSVTSLDAVLLRQLILGIKTELPENNTSWRFVAAQYQFSTEDPLQESFPEFIVVNGLSSTMVNLDFIAIKVGDVSGNAAANTLIDSELRTQKGKFLLELADQNVQKGAIIQVPILATNLAVIEGYQFTLVFNDLEFISLKEGIAQTDNFNTSLTDRGYITTSWNAFSSKYGEDERLGKAPEEVLFQLAFKAQRSGQLHEFLHISSSVTTAEAYHKNGDLLEVALQIDKSTTASNNTLELYQNQPNPFKEATSIGFHLPEAGRVRLSVLDMQGKVIYSENKTFEKGKNTLSINKSLPEGTYFYQLATAFGIQTKKMIVLK